MTARPTAFHAMPRARFGPAGARRFVEWLLILMLALDLIGAPLHAHRHEGQVFASSAAGVHAAPGAMGAHAERDLGPGFSHSISALRNETVEAALPASSGPDIGPCRAPDAGVPGACVVAATPAANDVPVPVHRSLPPQGRAPPLRG